MRIAEPDDLALAHEHDGKRALDTAQRSQRASIAAWLGQQVEDDFAVNGGLEDRALGLEFFAELGGVDEIAVVRDRELAAVGIDDERLGVLAVLDPVVE